MICSHCGNKLKENTYTCPVCGVFIGKYSGSAPSGRRRTATRQQRNTHKQVENNNLENQAQDNVYGKFDDEFTPLTYTEDRRTSKVAEHINYTSNTNNSDYPHFKKNKMVNARKFGRVKNYKQPSKFNWLKMIIALTILAVIAFVLYYIYMTQTTDGHLITARKIVISTVEEDFELVKTKDPLLLEQKTELLESWESVPTYIYWQVAKDYFDMGDINTSIVANRLADVLDPSNYDGLISLAVAYEINDDDASAEKVYLHLVKEVAPFREEAYNALIQMYQELDRNPEAAEMMLLAYKNTERETFNTLRNDFIPEKPEVDLLAGRYELDQVVNLTSPQGYDIYYTTDEKAKLPEEGVLVVDGTMTLGEGTLNLRAVTVSDDLVSDELNVTYIINYPRPPAPNCNLAPNTYDRLYSVSLRPGEEAEDVDQLRFFYTIDGSTPTENSPEYDGTPIPLPAGRVTLKAICVNQYEKVSNSMQISYKFEVKPYLKTVYSREDVFEDFVINITTQDEFYERFGKPNAEIPTTYINFEGEAIHAEYNWGYAVFYFNGIKWILVRVDCTSGISNAPRGVGMGSSEQEIVDAFKDFGQPQNKDKSRGLYFAYPNVGEIKFSSSGQRYIHYSCLTLNNLVQSLDFYLDNNQVVRIVHHVTQF